MPTERISLKPGQSVLVKAVLDNTGEDIFGVGKKPKVEAQAQIRRFVRAHDLGISMLEGAGPDEEIDLLIEAGPEIMAIIASMHGGEISFQQFLDTVVSAWSNAPRNSLTPEQMSDRAKVLLDFMTKIAEST